MGPRQGVYGRKWSPEKGYRTGKGPKIGVKDRKWAPVYGRKWSPDKGYRTGKSLKIGVKTGNGLQGLGDQGLERGPR